MRIYCLIINWNFIWNIDLNNGVYCDLHNKSGCLNTVLIFLNIFFFVSTKRNSERERVRDIVAQYVMIHAKSLTDAKQLTDFNGVYPLSAIRTYPMSAIKTKYKKIFRRRFPLSRFLAKTLSVKKNCEEKFLQNLSFAVDFKL